MSSASASTGTVYLLDSSVLILSLRGDMAVSARIASAGTVCVPSIALGELYSGAYHLPSRQQEALLEVEVVERTAISLSLDSATARIYGRIQHELRIKGYTMPTNDLWIAATAIQYGLTLAARDIHFDWIDGLSVEQW
jgi:tRNA(fMet)-specific endonuclease VapC